MPTIVPIVEGYGEVAAVPLLLRRLLSGLSAFDIRIATPPVNTRGVGALAKEPERFLEYALLRPACDGIIVIHDSEGKCPLHLAADLMARALAAAGYARPVAVVIAREMYESWLVASLGTIAGSAGLPDDVSFEGDPEDLANPKAWLDRQMPPGRAYKETIDQVAMTARLDPKLARRCRSFCRLEAALAWLVPRIRAGEAGVDPHPDALAARLADPP